MASVAGEGRLLRQADGVGGILVWAGTRDCVEAAGCRDRVESPQETLHVELHKQFLEKAGGAGERRRARCSEKQVKFLRDLNKVDPEGVIWWFESRPLPQHSAGALAEYLKALVKVDRLDDSALLKTLQRE
ncbi:ATP-dependent zinc metalloprotease FTSH 5, mitochondrial [Selaginella moellendorffii]|uniref:ATP-dependent zinc metalloprotease FTSH 5, mitochondrial n=1 Tax=Selaginella moellendorffii TaxID=88036 RepID=UPI000D1CD619|nr:ATP-dependent zinc metalloprotease FTSH 5, mitochondrial [Selaginella moellendorffii]|eukprot:XP_024532554.1 ATP-dependent zinc metalloprotease FTSH 5, mitochondrial [Selaginella moellendorffii]